jgi:hypothetical protein
MLRRYDKSVAIAAFLTIALFVLPVSGALFTVPGGGTAFIGEQGLDITRTGAMSNSNVGWFGTTNDLSLAAPLATTSVDDAKDFMIDPMVFGGKTGPWYILPDKKLAFHVADPDIKLRIFDETSNFEVTGTSTPVPKGDQLGFVIETNLIDIAKRPDVTMMPVTIHVMTDNGFELAEVSNYPLTGIMISSSPFQTGPVWDTGMYAPGTYTVWAECNVNRMKDNYPVDGKTETPQAGNVQILGPDANLASPGLPTQAGGAGTTRSTPVATTIATAGTTLTQTTSLPATAPVPPATTRAEGPDLVLIVGVLGLAAVIILGKDSP